jgi:hypothetical protein
MAVPRERIEARREMAIEPHATGPAYQAYQVLLVAFTVAPIVAGLDKFFHVLVNWDQYVHPAIPSMLGIQAHTFMMAVGVVEIVAGLIVAMKPSIGGWIVALWLWAIIVNLLAMRSYFDIALRDLGLSLGAIGLARLAAHFDDLRDED